MTDNTETTSDTKTSTSNWKETHPEVGALWIKDGREQKYMSGYVELEDGKRSRVIVYSNKYKNNDNAPDFRVYLSNSEGSSEVQTGDAFESLASAPSPEAQSNEEDLL